MMSSRHYMAAMVEKDNAYLTTAHRNARDDSAMRRCVRPKSSTPFRISTIASATAARMIGIAVLDLAGQPVYILEPSPTSWSASASAPTTTLHCRSSDS